MSQTLDAATLRIAEGEFVYLVGLWQLAANVQIWSPLLLPAPTNVFIYLWSAVKTAFSWKPLL